jgi:putative nucleotidyltransferase with HDIG domain
MKIPSIENARTLMAEAQGCNPGPWVSHSRYVAEAAEAIARQVPSLDPQVAFILGYLHDIGRRAGVTHMRHVLDGHEYLAHLGYPQAARVCLTHSFPVKDVHAIVGTWEGCDKAELDFIQNYLDRHEYNEYDKLIQLCDSIALPSGFCLMEKRLVDVALRYGVNQYTLPRWKAFFGIQAEFEQKLNGSIYDCLPGVMENTFTTNLALIDSSPA